MAIVTIVGVEMAKPGTEFVYRGPVAGCAGCRLHEVCHSLKPNRTYRVAKVRPVRHAAKECGVFDGDVAVVEVEETPALASINASAARGTGVTWRPQECHKACPWRPVCQTTALTPGSTCQITEVLEKPECAMGYDLRIARLRPPR